MTKKDKRDFALLMAKLETAFFETISKETTALYFDYLGDLSMGQISRAVDFILIRREKRGFPAIAEIRKATLGSMEHKAVQAWGELIGQIYHIDKAFLDPLIEKVAKIAFGGLNNFYSGDERNEMADRAHFIRTYQLIANLEEANADRKKLKQGETRAELQA